MKKILKNAHVLSALTVQWTNSALLYISYLELLNKLRQ
jgi:hypothetical protein